MPESINLNSYRKMLEEIEADIIRCRKVQSRYSPDKPKEFKAYYDWDDIICDLHYRAHEVREIIEIYSKKTGDKPNDT